MTGNSNSGHRSGDGLCLWRGKKIPLALEMPAAVFKLLQAAAARRDMDMADLAVGLIGATVCRGNIEFMLNQWSGYLFAGQRVRDADAYAPRKQKPIRDEQPAQAGEV